MILRELIDCLAAQDPTLIVPLGFTHPHSYRGRYHELAFEPAKNVTIGTMLKDARSALGQTFEGYKGGEFTMGEWTEVNLAEYGETGETIGHILIWYMINAAKRQESEQPDDNA